MILVMLLSLLLVDVVWINICFVKCFCNRVFILVNCDGKRLMEILIGLLKLV